MQFPYPHGGVWQLLWEVNRSQGTRDISHPRGVKFTFLEIPISNLFSEIPSETPLRRQEHQSALTEPSALMRTAHYNNK